jgi:hypothetical protein
MSSSKQKYFGDGRIVTKYQYHETPLLKTFKKSDFTMG